MDGYETAQQLRTRWPELKILALTMYNHEFSIIKMLKNGANGYLLKGSDLDELQKALNEVYYKGYYSSELVASNFFQMMRLNDQDQLYKINEKEMQFLSYCCTDLNYKEIALEMGLGVRTIESYRNTLFEKLNLNTRIGLVMFAINTGIVYKENNPGK
jgi:DNA-binding NarL/FixJ family response regulator